MLLFNGVSNECGGTCVNVCASWRGLCIFIIKIEMIALPLLDVWILKENFIYVIIFFLYNVIFKFFVKISTQKLSIVLILQGNHVVTCKAKEDVALRKTIIIIIIIKASSSSSSSKHQQFQHQSLATCIWVCVSVYYLEYMYTVHTLSRAPSSIPIAFFRYFSILSKHTCMHVSTEQKSRQVQIQSPFFLTRKKK